MKFQGVFFGTEHSIGRGAGGAAQRQQQGDLGTVIAQPPVVTAVDLHQHPSLGHPLQPHPVLGRTPATRAGQNMPYSGNVDESRR